MAFHDLHGQTAGSCAAPLDVTNRRFEAPLAMLLPNGPAWPRDDPTLKRLVAALTTEFSRQAVRAAKLDRELNPATTFETLTDWEESYGLPDCAQPETLEARRAALAAKLLAQTGHDQSLAFWTDLFGKLGYLIKYIDHGPYAMTCMDDCMDVLADESWVFVWSIAVEHGLDDALLECLVAHNSIIGTLPLLHYPWTPVALPEPIDFAGVASSDKGYTVAVGGNKIVYAGASLGSWDLAATQAEDLYAVCAVGSIFVAVGVNSTVAVRSTDDGATWSAATPFAAPELYAISRGPLDDLVAVAVGEDGQIWRTDDAGATYTEEASPTSAYLLGVCCCTGAMVAVGAGGVVLRSTANGTAWSIVAAGITDDLFAVGGRLAVVVAVGEKGGIWRSDDAGASWTKIPSPTAVVLLTVAGSSTGRWVAAGEDGVILQSLDGGLTWELQASPTASDLRGSCTHHPDGQLVVVGASAAIILE